MIRETVETIKKKERRVSERDLAKRLGLPKQTISWRVLRALEKGWLVNEGPPNRRPYRLRRGGPLPGDVPPLPQTRHVEGLFEGVPAPGSILDPLFGFFATNIASRWPGGVTVAEWAAWVKRDPVTVRGRLDILLRRNFSSMIIQGIATASSSGLPSVTEGEGAEISHVASGQRNARAVQLFQLLLGDIPPRARACPSDAFAHLLERMAGAFTQVRGFRTETSRTKCHQTATAGGRLVVARR